MQKRANVKTYHLDNLPVSVFLELDVLSILDIRGGQRASGKEVKAYEEKSGWTTVKALIIVPTEDFIRIRPCCALLPIPT